MVQQIGAQVWRRGLDVGPHLGPGFLAVVVVVARTHRGCHYLGGQKFGSIFAGVVANG